MAIKNPNPNIKDFEVNDNTTWSSNHIAAGLNAAGVVVGSEGEVNTTPYSLIKEVTLEEGASSYEVTDLSCKNVFAIVTFSADSSTTGNIYLRFKTPEGGSSYFAGPGVARASLTSGSNYIAMLEGTCEHGVVLGNGFIATGSGNANVQRQNSSSYFTNIFGSVFNSVQVYSTITLPAGTNIKIYGY